MPLTAPAWVFLIIAVVILGAPILAERARLPGVIGLVVAGIAVGPAGMGLLSREGAIEQLGGFGLLYLMFLVGLELDLEVLRVNVRPTVVFGLLTFVIPMSVGTVSALLLGFGGFASLLIGSVCASHTLVAYPVIRRSGIVGDGAVAAAVGATVVTDTLALVVLAGVAGSYESDGGVGFLVRLTPGVLVLAFGTLWGLPRLARWFFTGLGQDRTLRFLFVLSGFLSAAVLADLVGVEGIVGAFLAGLALNAAVPNGGALMQRVEFVGSSLFIPIFLISIGMLVDPRAVFDPSTLRLATVITAVAMGTKWAAAEIAGRSFRFARPQIGVMFALSNARAAAALATTIVGFEIGLFAERVVNAVLIVILVTVVISSWVAARSASGVVPPAPAPGHLGRTVLVPVANPDAAPDLVRMAAWVTRADGGQIVPFHIVPMPDPERVRASRPLLAGVEATAARLGSDVDAFVRVDRSIASGVLNTVVERDATLVMLGWKGASTTRDRLFGSLFDDIVARAPCVVAACWLPTGSPRRLILLSGIQGEALPGDEIAALEMCKRLAKGSGLPVAVIAPVDQEPRIVGDPGWERIRVPFDVECVAAVVRLGDLFVVPGSPGRSVVGSMVNELAAARPDLDLIVVHGSTPIGDVEIGEVFAGG